MRATFSSSAMNVLFDGPSKHFPDRIEIELHTDPKSMARSIRFSLPLCRDGQSLWRQAGPPLGWAIWALGRTSVPRLRVELLFFISGCVALASLMAGHGSPTMVSLSLPLQHDEAMMGIAAHPEIVDPPAPSDRSSNAEDRSVQLARFDRWTAVYDISAHTVYLPNGTKLEAHSGLGARLDDPRFVHERMRGATPPSVYELALREKPFHGVRALRLKPTDGGKVFGRRGLLAHTYMLGPKGDSNGCVVFKDYNVFLQAFEAGVLKRLAVVARLDSASLQPPADALPLGQEQRHPRNSVTASSAASP
jgi:hypothetical protein